MVDEQTEYQTAQLVLVEELRTALADYDQHQRDARCAEQHVLQLLKDIARMPHPPSPAPQDVEAMRWQMERGTYKGYDMADPTDLERALEASEVLFEGEYRQVRESNTYTAGGQAVKTEVRCPEWKTP